MILTSATRLPSTPMHWVLQTETRTFGPPPTDAAAGDVLVDWVAVWRRDPQPPAKSKPDVGVAGDPATVTP